MKCRYFPILTLSSLISFAACERKVIVIEKPSPEPVSEPIARTKTLETSRLGAAIDDFEREPTAANKAEVNKAFAKLDGEIAELQEYIAKHDGDDRAKAAAKLENMQSYRGAETTRFASAQAKSGLGIRGPADARTGAEKVEDSTKKVGNGIEDAAKKAGDAVKDAVR
jgi:hypothetical protein